MSHLMEEVKIHMSGISAGTGPAAAILIGGLLYANGNGAGLLLITAGIGLSALWAFHFK